MNEQTHENDEMCAIANVPHLHFTILVFEHVEEQILAFVEISYVENGLSSGALYETHVPVVEDATVPILGWRRRRRHQFQ